nr:uncharacterized protein K02A2.6-like [Dermacentor andersoni]
MYRGEELVQWACRHKTAEQCLQQGCLLWGSWVVIPQSLWSRALQLLHAGHLGVEKTKMMAKSHVWCPGLDQDFAHMAQSCQVCQEHQRAPRSTTAALRQAFAARGLPGVIVSEEGPAFASTEHLAWLTKNGILWIMVLSYYPASNSAAERLVPLDHQAQAQEEPGRGFPDGGGPGAVTVPDHAPRHHWPCPGKLMLDRMAKTPLDILHADLRSTALLMQLKQKLAANQGCRPGP